MTEYTPDEDEMRDIYGDRYAYMRKEADAEFDRFLARVRRDAAREALDGLIDAAQREHDRAPAPYRYRLEKVVSIATEHRDTHYPEETP